MSMPGCNRCPDRIRGDRPRREQSSETREEKMLQGLKGTHSVLRSLIATAAVAGVAFASFGAVAQEKERVKLHVLLPTGGAASMFTNFVASELGFYEDENLEVEFNQGGET